MISIQSSVVDEIGVDITGHITDEDSNPLAGVTILITGTSYGAISDANGKYLIEDYSASDSISLQVRKIGMCPVDTVVEANTLLMIIDFRLLVEGDFLPLLSSRMSRGHS